MCVCVRACSQDLKLAVKQALELLTPSSFQSSETQNFIACNLFCRNLTLAKCGGEAQHLEKLEVWSPPGLPNVQSSTKRP